MTTVEQVAEFHKAFGVAVRSWPDLSDKGVNQLRYDLLLEEVTELGVALIEQDPVATLDALVDIQYVLDGAFLALGFYKVKDAAFREVHSANMRKLTDGRPVKREDGKILKPRGWQPPDLSKFV